MTLKVILFGNSDIVAARSAFVEELRKHDVQAEFAFLEANKPGAVQRAHAELQARAAQVDLVHSFDTGPNVLAGRAMASVDTPHMATITGRGQLFSGRLATAKPLHAIYVATFRRALRNSAQIVCQNSSDAEYFNGLVIGPPVTTVIGSGVDVNRYMVPTEVEQAAGRTKLGVADNSVVVSLPTRMLKSKGVPQFLEAAEQLHRERPGQYQVLLAGGSGTPRNPRNADMSKVSSQGPTRYLGSLSDMDALYAATDILALPTSYSEGLARVLLEGAGAGCQLISTPAPGSTDVIDSDKVGYILPTPVTSVGIVAAILDRTQNLDAASRELRRTAFLDKRLDLASIAEQYAAIYHRIAG